MKKLMLILTCLMMTSVLFAEIDKKPKSDAEITNMVMTINTEEMNLAKVGKKNAQNEKVKEFADTMFKTHAKNNDKFSALRREQNIPLKETKRSMTLKSSSQDKIERLKNLSDKQFDRAYMETQVDMHKKALDKFDNTLIPNAKDPELKALLQNTRGKIESHLRHAEELNSSLL